MSDRVSIEIVEHVADVRLARPEKMNALDPAMFDALIKAGETIRDDRRIRAVVLSGDGQAFCAGLDLATFKTLDEPVVTEPPRDLVARTHGMANRIQYAALQWRELAVPVIASVHGVAFGGGFQLMLGADIRIIHPDTRLSLMELKWGLIPDMAGTMLMRGLVRPDIIAELTYTGRIFDGSEAARIGLATRLSDDPMADSLGIACAIAAKSPDAIRAAKRLLTIGDRGMAAKRLQAESIEQQALIGTPNQIEAIRSALAKRAPCFTDGPGVGH